MLIDQHDMAIKCKENFYFCIREKNGSKGTTFREVIQHLTGTKYVHLTTQSVLELTGLRVLISYILVFLLMNIATFI